MTTLQFADTHNLVAFLSKPAESEGFEQIVDFLNANPIRYALTINPTIYTSCIEQFWATAKVKTVNGEVQLQALVDGKKIIVTEASVRQFVLKCLDETTRKDVKILKGFYVTTLSKKIFRNIRRVGKGFYGRETPLFLTMMVQAHQEQGEGSEMPTDPHHIPTIIQPSTSQPLLKQRSRRPNRKDTQELTHLKVMRDRLKLNELMEFCTKLQQRVLDLENTKTAQAQEITSLKLRVKKLEKKGGSIKILTAQSYTGWFVRRVISSNETSLGDQEDASKQGRKIDDIDKDAEITLVDETQGRFGDEEMFDTGVLDGDEEKANVVEEPSESITTTPTLTTTIAATTIIAVSTRPRAKGLVIHEEEQATTPTVSSQQPSQVKAQDKGKGVMVEEPMKMKKKYQISLDKELVFKLQAEEEEEERLAREKAQQIKETNIVSWDNIQAMIDADYQMAQQMQAEEQEKLSIEEKSKFFVQLL
ncbi:hypothetical protein Tco_1122167 [Tanacetum coccineum]|uniref:Xylulose kinase-1 n=1 Tax=Tanacetum coccineum TaxID=301880 RepID=A0ABQ5IZV2_9ASTR